jgi:hypothetical protein
MPTIDSHASVGGEVLRREAIESLLENRLEPKFLYVSPGQAQLWKEVFLKHSPIHANTAFARIYLEAFAKMTAVLPAEKIYLVGMGCGTGMKEVELCARLMEKGRKVLFSAIDVSRELVRESAQKLIEAEAEHERSLVCDLSQAEFLGEWLNGQGGAAPRLITFFGLFPNFVPSTVTRLFHSILRPGDMILASTHLVPVDSENREELLAGMKVIMPQYDNPETHAWLGAALKHWGLEERVDAPEIKIGAMEGIPAFLGLSRWKTDAPFERWGHHFKPNPQEPLRLFYSLRYTPRLFEDLLRREGFSVELVSITPCQQEALWCIRSG